MILSIQDIQKLQDENPSDLFIGYTWAPTTETSEPKLKSVRVFFRNARPDIWRKLTTSQSMFDIDIGGTRNAPHDALDPCYRALLDDVNSVRQKLGQTPIID